MKKNARNFLKELQHIIKEGRPGTYNISGMIRHLVNEDATLNEEQMDMLESIITIAHIEEQNDGDTTRARDISLKIATFINSCS